MADQVDHEADARHKLMNHLGVIIGYCELLLSELPDADPRREEIAEIEGAARAALALVPDITRRIRERRVDQ